MPVNLLPQTAPQTHPDARAVSKVDDPGNDAPTFSATLAAAANAAAKAPQANAGAATAGRDGDGDSKPATIATQEDLAALLLPGVTPVVIDTALVNGAGARAVLADTGRPDIPSGDKRAPPASTDAPGMVVPSLAMLVPEMQTAAPRVTAATPANREAGDVIAPRVEPKSAPRGGIERMPVEAAPPEKAEATVKIAVTTIANDATHALRDSHEQKPLRSIDTLTTPTADARAVSTAPPAPPVQITIATPALTPAWRDDVTQQLAQLVVMRQDRAEIRLNPADLGPISVQIHMEGGQANLLIQAPQAATRDGLELALPQLRDSLAQQGITLGETSIRDQRDSNPQSGEGASSYSGSASRDPVIAVEAPVRVRVGLVDLFA
ncbi:MAG TPA: flagellar hook-length control protein FliK [Burkholderiales bacterium]|nr:flagellar hook-length control protein FliK [Burkholderiales bacterium]